MDQLRRQLMRRAHLFDDPAAYEAGVRDALAAVAAQAQDAVADVTLRVASAGPGDRSRPPDDVTRHVADADPGDRSRLAAAMRAHPAAGRRPLRAVGGSTA